MRFPGDVRRILYTTNAIEALNSKLRRAGRARGHFPSDEAPIRVEVFAHTDPKAVVEDRFRETLVGDIEDFLHDLNKIRTAVFQLLEIGREHWIAGDDRTYADPFIADVRNVLSRV
jgi:hypothetical protein